MTVRLRVSRSRAGDSKRHFDDFEANVGPGSTVLDALLDVRRRLDPSLVVRHSCRHASCGGCGVRVDGRPVLACDTRLDRRSSRPIVVEPLDGRAVVADLATDMTDFHARMDAVGLPPVRTGEPADVVPPDGVGAFSRLESCIECGLCLAACPVARTDGSFIGPAALAAAARVVEEPRGHELGPVLALAVEPDAIWRCRDAMECTAVCPAAVDPARALFGLRRRIAAERVRRLFRRAGG